jgi:hypothetical protein
VRCGHSDMPRSARGHADVRTWRAKVIHHGRVNDREDMDGIGQSLSDLEAGLIEIAHIHREELGPGIVAVEIDPRNPKALPMTWTFLGQEIVVQAGRHGGRWELARTPEDVAFMKRLVRSIVAGRVRETFGPKRSCVEVTMEDGSIVSETGYANAVPVPGWKRRGRTVAYGEYAG